MRNGLQFGAVLGVLALAGFLIAPCGCGSDGSGSSLPSSGTSGSGASTGSGANTAPAPPAAPSLATLLQEEEQRRLAYLQAGAQGTSFYAQVHKLETGASAIDPAPVRADIAFMDSRKDTADFRAARLTRLLNLHAGHPALAALTPEIEAGLLRFRWALEEPGTDEMVFWSENHQIIFASSAYLAGQHMPQAVFTSSGLTGQQLMARERPKIMRWLEDRFVMGYSEWYSPVYYPHDISPLLNLIDFAQDTEIQSRASMALDLIVFDFARFTQAGSFGMPAGRVYLEHKLGGRRQSVGDLIEVLFGSRGTHGTGGSTSATAYVTSRRYKVPPVLLAIAAHQPSHSIDRSRSGISFTDGPALGRGFATFDDGLRWWGMGAYVAPETIRLTRRMIEAYDLWNHPNFQLFTHIRNVPSALLPPLSTSLSPLSEGSVLSTAHIYTQRIRGALLSSVQSYRKGQVGFQQHLWQATLDLDACVFTTQPGTMGRSGPGEWTGSGSMPRLVQREGTLLAIYNPPIAQKAMFPALTHAYFPKAAFDEVREQGSWMFGRKGDGYVGLYSARPWRFETQGTYADQELISNGFRNVFVCQVGNTERDGTFDEFVQRTAHAAIQVQGASTGQQTDPISVTFEAPGLGALAVAWKGEPTLNGQPFNERGFPRFDNDYSQVPFGSRVIDIRFRGSYLHLDLTSGLRAGTGL